MNRNNSRLLLRSRHNGVIFSCCKSGNGDIPIQPMRFRAFRTGGDYWRFLLAIPRGTDERLRVLDERLGEGRLGETRGRSRSLD